ncbi:MAG: T9SS type A sorting domain-containing protein [Saprospiraceae bacterium]|nr:T9SS type A sorting domain-containing protein [Saprospiraceae bacterium]
MTNKPMVLLFLFIFTSFCQLWASPPTGKIRVTTVVDGVTREYFIHVPASYDGSKKVPLVFMLHGTSGDGETFYNAHGWTELADQEGFLAVFPSSGRYKIIDEGEYKTTTKWNTTPDAGYVFQPGEVGLDDIKFLRQVVYEMFDNYNIDTKRVYLNGFSNGGQMAAKCSVEMSDLLAAVAQNASSFFIDTTYVPKRKLPVLYQVGNKDYGPGNEGPEASLSLLDSLISTPNIPWLNGKHYRIAHSHIRNFDLQETYTIEGDTNTAVVATYLPNHPGPGTGYEFKFIFVKGLAHIYPNGVNHFFDAPAIHWNWMKQYVLEDDNNTVGQKVRVTTNVDNKEREYYVHIPSSYDGNKEVPLVFMLHGTSGDGETFYNAHGWTELSDQEGFLAVFPSSGKYKIIDDGVNKNISKWNTTPDADWAFQPGETGLDDIKFLRKVVDEMKSNYNIDAKRIYLNGFSNGGQMAAKCAIDMSDILAAVAENTGSFFLDTTYVPKRKLPILYQVGNKDYGPGNEGPEGSLAYLDSLLTTPGIPWMNGKHYRVAHNHIRNFDLQETFTIEGDTNTAFIATYLPNHPGPGTGYEFKFIFVKGLAHQYPNGNNHFFDAPRIHWDWMKQYTLEDSTETDGQKIRVITSVQDTNREYFLHIPTNYNSSQKSAMVIFLHGSGQNGNQYYNISGWNGVADTANIVMAYPSALEYCVTEDGVTSVRSKFSAFPQDGAEFCPGQVIKNDVLFISKVIEEVSAKYSIDANRIYIVGFSNGGEMAARCALDLGDKISACVSTGGGGALPRDTVLIPIRKMPMMNMFGNKDAKILKGLNLTVDSVPMGFDLLYGQYPVLYGKQVVPYIEAFDLDASNYTLIGNPNSVVASIFNGKSNDPQSVFYNVEVKDLEHEYPNGVNHPMLGALYHWIWMKKYQLGMPDSTASFTLSTQGGHGGGSYAEGKKIHIWSAQQDGKVFTHWTGDVQYLASAKEYHTVVTMPGKNISVQANYAELLPTMKLLQVDVQGAQKVKKLYVHLPPKNEMKGLIWFFHGTDGNAAAMATNIEVKQFMDLMMTKKFGIIAITSEESQDGVDYDANGAIQWSYGIDSTLIDYANIRAVRDSLLRRGLLDPKTPHLAYGYSAGAAFSELVVNVLNWKAAIGHTVAGSPQLSLVATKPFFLSINENDRHPGVGPAGNAQARENHTNYANRGVCAELHEFSQSPLFPERFDRSLFITEPLSKAIYNEMKENNMLDENSVLKGLFSELQFQVFSNPNKFPIITALNQLQLKDLEDQISVTNAEHKPKADINGQLVEWLGSLCGTVSVEDVIVADVLKVYPNPSTVGVWLEAEANWALFDLNGRQLLSGHSSYVDVSQLMAGMYILESNNEKVKIIKR